MVYVVERNLGVGDSLDPVVEEQLETSDEIGIVVEACARFDSASCQHRWLRH